MSASVNNDDTEISMDLQTGFVQHCLSGHVNAGGMNKSIPRIWTIPALSIYLLPAWINPSQGRVSHWDPCSLHFFRSPVWSFFNWRDFVSCCIYNVSPSLLLSRVLDSGFRWLLPSQFVSWSFRPLFLSHDRTISIWPLVFCQYRGDEQVTLNVFLITSFLFLSFCETYPPQHSLSFLFSPGIEYPA